MRCRNGRTLRTSYDATQGTPTYGANAVYNQDTLQYTTMSYFAETFFPSEDVSGLLRQATFTSPFAATFGLPLTMDLPELPDREAQWGIVAAFFGFWTAAIFGLLATMCWLFNARWRVND